MSSTELQSLQVEIEGLLGRWKRPKKAVVTAGMPYANGPLHLGHLAGAHIPADIHARWLRMMIGKENVLFVCGTDDHGSTSEVAAKTSGTPIREFIKKIHDQQESTLKRYGVSLDIYTGTSRETNYKGHKEYCQNFLRKLHKNKMLEKKATEQWFDPKLNMFLPDRYVVGECPNPKCDNKKAYSEECDVCGLQYPSQELKNPQSTLSDSTPVLQKTEHWWLNMWKVSDQLNQWIESKKKTWRKNVYLETINTVLPSLSFSNKHEETFKSLKESLPKHKSRYAPGKTVVVQLENLSELEKARKILEDKGVETALVDSWAHRSITRDVAWGIPVPTDLDEGMENKTLYVWPESLIAPISFSQEVLQLKGKDPAGFKDFWTDPEAKVYQYIGQDNIFFYVLMQGAMWLGTQEDPFRLPKTGELQMTDVIPNYHLQIDGMKMSKSKGNFYTGDQLLDELGFFPEQVRYFLAILGLSEKNSNFDFETFKQRNAFLAGPMNAAFEKPISAAHSKFAGKVPEGNLLEKAKAETVKILQNYFSLMEKAEYSKILFQIENYARIINSIFVQYKPHDDRHDLQGRKDGLFTSFFILKNIMLMLYPFVPQTMEKLRMSLGLPENVFQIEEFGRPLQAGHTLGEIVEYFPSVDKI